MARQVHDRDISRTLVAAVLSRRSLTLFSELVMDSGTIGRSLSRARGTP